MISFTCITFQSCNTSLPVSVFYASSPITDGYFESEIGNVVQITEPANFPDIYYTVLSVCYSYQATPESSCEGCFNNGTALGFSGDTFRTYVTSTESTTCPVNNAYVLVNCKAPFIEINAPADLIQDPDTVLVTSSDLALYVGSVINISEYPNNCYTVFGPYTEDTGCPCGYYTVTNAYKDCECCLPDEPEVFVRTSQKPVKKYYHITDSECEIRTNTKFANNYYKLFNTIKNGMGNCCDGVDFDKLWIEKELSDYSRINPPGECTFVPVPEEIAECPLPILVECVKVESVTGSGDLR